MPFSLTALQRLDQHQMLRCAPGALTNSNFADVRPPQM
jgi:hypothetical protein